MQPITRQLPDISAIPGSLRGKRRRSLVEVRVRRSRQSTEPSSWLLEAHNKAKTLL